VNGRAFKLVGLSAGPPSTARSWRVSDSCASL